MASTVSDGSESAARVRRAQRGLTGVLLRDVRALRRLIVPSRLQSSVSEWIAALIGVVGRYGETAATVAADFYEAERAAAGVRGTFTVPLAGAPPDEQVEASLRWAAKDLWPRDAQAATVAQREPLTVRLEAVQVKAEGAVQKLVSDQGRATVRQAVRRDREAVAYARAAALGGCSFCKLLASRGAVFKDARAAGREADARFSGDASAVKFHDNCHCGIIPVFRGQRFELSAHAAEWDRLYQEYAAGRPGDQLRLFRRALAEHDSNPLPGSD
ncbi:hypothetical protein [Streptomyces uncialis]|uniref:Capsid maturation protease n=1 Tax=Streptomyces uncialis TaxID=1048205 RepID=A0A1Q4V120_9ACTN|nr:hypothetical protein [Streptomyces uncialis]OKH91496.1 hypothetical protein AB852_28480 [Streptomyces uncialis]